MGEQIECVLRHLRVLAVVGVIVAACSHDVPIRIGLAGPFSEGRATSMLQSAELAVREINGRGGVGGRTIELVVLDDSADTDVAVRVARELYDTGNLIAVVGHLTSGATLAAAPVYGGGDDPVVQISPSASSPLLSDAGPYTFRICPSDLVHGSRLAEWARARLGTERAAVLYENTDYGRGVRAAFSASFTQLGGEIVSEDPYVEGLPGFAPFLERIQRQGGADVLFLAGPQAGGRRVAATMDSIGFRPQIMGGDGLVGIEDADDAEGMLISTAYLPDRPGDRNADYVRAYRAAYRNQLPDHRAAGAYDAVYLLAEALEAVGADRERIREYLARIGSDIEPFQGVTGLIAFDGNGDVPEKDVVIGRVSGGRLTVAPGQ
jgi:branched-chain amino acid transport system substrate-binding protein